MTLGGLLLLDTDTGLAAFPVANNSTNDIAADALVVVINGAVLRVRCADDKDADAANTISTIVVIELEEEEDADIGIGLDNSSGLTEPVDPDEPGLRERKYAVVFALVVEEEAPITTGTTLVSTCSTELDRETAPGVDASGATLGTSLATASDPDDAVGLLLRVSLTGALDVDDEEIAATFSVIFLRLVTFADVDAASPAGPIDGLNAGLYVTPFRDAEDAGIELDPLAVKSGVVEPDRQANLKRNLALSDVTDEDKADGVGLIVDTDAYHVPIPAAHEAPDAANVYVAAYVDLAVTISYSLQPIDEEDEVDRDTADV